MANLSGTPKYTLTITSDDASVPNLVLSENDVTEFNKVRVSLTSLEITKQMYEPCKVEALIQFMDSDMVIVDMLSNLLGKKVTLSDGVDTEPIAKHYVLCDFEPEFRPSNGTTNLYVKLSIYSPEKLLTYTKGNSCYVAKKLGDVFKDIADGAKIDKSINLQNIVLGEAKKESSTDSGNGSSNGTSNSATTGSAKSNTTSKGELIQPYMVQFEETQVEFLSRMANRCGEFLFFEDGVWQLGAKSTAEAIQINNYTSLSFRKFTAMQPGSYSISNYAEEDKTETTEKNSDMKETTGNNTTSSQPSGSETVGNNDASSKPLDDKNGDSKSSKSGSTQSTPLSQNSNQNQNSSTNSNTDGQEENVIPYQQIIQYSGPSDEYLEPIEKQSGESVRKMLKEQYDDEWVSYIPELLAEDNLIKMIMKVGTDALENSLIAKTTKNKKADEYNEKFFKDFQEESMDGSDTGYPLTSAFGKKKFSSKFFNYIEEQEKTSERRKIHINLGTNYISLRLGNIIEILGQKYFIIQINNMLKHDEINENNKVLINLDIDAVPINNNYSYPCPLTGGNIRKSAPQLATVTSVKDPMEIGRIQISYPWQEETANGKYSSPWIRVSTTCATEEAGLKFMPQVGDQIMVGYENGNIERPYMIGSLATKERGGADESYMLKSPNGQYIKFNNSPFSFSDLLGTFVPAYNTVLKYFPQAKPDWSNITKYGGGIEIGDKLGFYKVSMSSADRSINISSTWGDVSINAFSGISISAPNGDIEINGKNISIVAGNELTLKSGENLSKKRFSFNFKDASSQIVSSIANNLVDKLDLRLDLSLLRNIAESIFKPVGGNMQIKSARFLRLEAGKDANAKLPPKAEKDETEKRKNDIISYNAAICAINVFDEIITKANSSKTIVDDARIKYNEKIVNLENIASKKKPDEFKLTYDKKDIQATDIKNQKEISFDEILAYFVKDEKSTVNGAMEKIKKLSLMDITNKTEDQNFQDKITEIGKELRTFIKSIKKVEKATTKVDDIKNEINKCQPNYQTNSAYRQDDNIKGKDVNRMKSIVEKAYDAAKNDIIQGIRKGLDDDAKKILKRQVVYTVIQELKKEKIILVKNEASKWRTFVNLFDDDPQEKVKTDKSVCNNPKDWDSFLECLSSYDEEEDTNNKWGKIKAVLLDRTDLQGFSNWTEKHSVNPEVKGEILMTDSEGNTLNFNGNTINVDPSEIVDKLIDALKGI